MTTVPIADIQVGTRSRRELRGIDGLAESIRKHSLLQPPVVRKDGDGWLLVCGARRIEAVKSLGWTEIPVTVAGSVTDELEALYAEGEENTEREPFTAVEAVEHRRRIEDLEKQLAKERQRQGAADAAARRLRDNNGRMTPGSANFEEPGEPVSKPPPHSRTTRARTARPTGFSPTTLDKAELVLDTAEDETQPEPVRRIAQESAERLGQHGAKVDREYKAVQQAIIDNSDHAEAYRDAQWRKQLATELSKLLALTSFPPERVVAICDDDLLASIDSVAAGISGWHAEITALRQPGLRIVTGKAR